MHFLALHSGLTGGLFGEAADASSSVTELPSDWSGVGDSGAFGGAKKLIIPPALLALLFKEESVQGPNDESCKANSWCTRAMDSRVLL